MQISKVVFEINIPQKSSSQLDQNVYITCFNPAFF